MPTEPTESLGGTNGPDARSSIAFGHNAKHGLWTFQSHQSLWVNGQNSSTGKQFAGKILNEVTELS